MAVTFTDSPVNQTSDNSLDISESVWNFMRILTCIIASVGISSNLTVVVVFLNHMKLRLKIPNRFIVNQVSISLVLVTDALLKFLTL